MAQARFVLDRNNTIAPVNRRVFGSFVEHLGRCVYNGIYEPGHELADAEGFRTDVLELVRELGVSTIRYPGGNFVSGYRWEDGIGPREQRPKRVDLAWHSIETNEVGIDEFARWATKAGGEMMLAVNLGTRGIEEALDLLEYTNVASGTHLSDMRIANGSPEPYNVRMWCLGNEMDGPWQVGHSDADEYGRLASKVARAMRRMDDSLELVLVGSSKAAMPTFASWERIALEHAYEQIDYVSCHAYYEELNGDLGSFLASSVNMDHFIQSIVATADHVKASLKSDKTINISFDEWNVWYNTRFHDEDEITDPEAWPYAPRLLEDKYSVADAVVVGSLMICLLRHSDRVTAASLAQLVNVIAPIMTEPNGPSWRQTIFYPFAQASAHAAGVVLRGTGQSDRYETATYGTVDTVDSVATWDEERGQMAIFIVNRSQTEEATVTFDLRDLPVTRVVSAQTLADSDPYARNTLEDQNRVVPQANDAVTLTGSAITIVVPPISWTTTVLA